jgi:hypothetical protein
MTRLFFVAVLVIGLVAAAPAQGPSNQPAITVSASSTGDGSGSGSISVSGTITTPAPWQLSIHTVTVRFRKDGGSKTLNVFIPVKGPNFSATVDMKRGGYTVWAVIDVKDAGGHEIQIQSGQQQANVP